MQNAIRFILIITASFTMGVRQAGASRIAIAEDPEFRVAWEAYKAVTPEARLHERPLSAIPVSATPASISMPNASAAASFGHEIDAFSPKAVCKAVRSRVRYTADETDYWQTAAETWNRKAGDCEDFAATVRDLCLARGVKAEMVIFHAKHSDIAHAVAIGEWNGMAWMSSNGDYREVGSLAEAREVIANEFHWNRHAVATYHVSGQETSLLQPAALAN